MTINKQDYELLKPLLDDPNKRIIVDVTILPEEFNRMARLLNDRLIKNHPRLRQFESLRFD